MPLFEVLLKAYYIVPAADENSAEQLVKKHIRDVANPNEILEVKARIATEPRKNEE